MSKNFYLLLFVLNLVFVFHTVGAKVPLDSLVITIRADNLSEDMNVLSSKNDEILLLAYKNLDSLILEEPLFTKELHFDESNRIKKIKVDQRQWVNSENILFIILELDTKKTLYQIDPVIRIHHDKIKKLYTNNDILGLKNYFGDEDLLGIEQLRINNMDKKMKFEFEGTHMLERYLYGVIIELK